MKTRHSAPLTGSAHSLLAIFLLALLFIAGCQYEGPFGQLDCESDADCPGEDSVCLQNLCVFDPDEGELDVVDGTDIEESDIEDDAGLSCPQNQILCDDSCVDTKTNPSFCGDCDTRCGAGESCQGGQCQPACGPDMDLCGDFCRNTQADPNHCGACNNSCEGDEVCIQGSCQIFCPPGYTDCDGTCINIDADPSFCGSCDPSSACDPGQVCSGGECTLSCAPGLTEIDGACRDTKTDPEFCGDPASSCGGQDIGEGTWVCTNGNCEVACADEYTLCDGGEGSALTCAFLPNDVNNCGSCGEICLTDDPNAIPACDSDGCGKECHDGFLDCGELCVPRGAGQCDVGEPCVDSGDCDSGVCSEDRCISASCTDGVKNGDETGVDCGGSCEPCADGKGCSVPADCLSGVCDGGVCQSPTCSDGVHNGDETDKDCGGPSCDPCELTQSCQNDGDCLSDVCVGEVCVECTDAATHCANDEICSNNECVCPAPSCSDVECGSVTNACGQTSQCGDCQSGVCSENQCVECTGDQHCGNDEICSNNQCVCHDSRPAAQICLDEGAQCGSVEDVCGNIIECPTCPGAQQCSENQCVECTGDEHCGNDEICSNNQCVCQDSRPVEDICAHEQAQCGSVEDACGNDVPCGDCQSGVCSENQCVECTGDEHCGNDEICSNNECVCQDSRPVEDICLDEGAQCGSVEDACGNSVPCGDCQSGVCSENQCVECTGDQHCGENVCDTDTNECVPCITGAEPFGGGNGSADAPYRICSIPHLKAVKNNLDTENYFRLYEDLEFEAALNSNFTPIGNTSAPFRGHFNGDGHKIAGLTIPNGGTIQGLFGVSEGTITNLILSNFEISGEKLVGALVGQNYGTISKVAVEGGEIEGLQVVGGLVGQNYGKISESSTYTTVIASDSESSAGGLVGITSQDSEVENSYSLSSVSGENTFGGLIGHVEGGTVEFCYAAGPVTSSLPDPSESSYVGGLIGANPNNSEVSNSYWDHQTTTQGGSEGGSSLSSTEFGDPNNFLDWDFTSVWKMGFTPAPSASAPIQRPLLR